MARMITRPFFKASPPARQRNELRTISLYSQLNSKVYFIKPKYSAETEINMSGIFNKYYYTDIKIRDWKTTIQNLKLKIT
ncbi:unnamed protein product [Clonostachys solani]|uniref:Uncharacterized protein n=1 Tax=Clonostachys solani TaxID=160281 RepID=A0A9N9ZH70_9HYPO|nr:unnamed protein product [Clonostachys solani]